MNQNERRDYDPVTGQSSTPRCECESGEPGIEPSENCPLHGISARPEGWIDASDPGIDGLDDIDVPDASWEPDDDDDSRWEYVDQETSCTTDALEIREAATRRRLGCIVRLQSHEQGVALAWLPQVTMDDLLTEPDDDDVHVTIPAEIRDLLRKGKDREALTKIRELLGVRR